MITPTGTRRAGRPASPAHQCPAPPTRTSSSPSSPSNDTAVPIAAWCAGATTPIPSTAALRDEVIRLLHPPPVGVSPNTGTALINLRTLFWVTTPTQRTLGQAKLIGFPVQLRITYDHTDFDFGDHTRDTLTTPGTPYDPTDDCGACTDRFGHNYTTRGTLTITARTYWPPNSASAPPPGPPSPAPSPPPNPPPPPSPSNNPAPPSPHPTNPPPQPPRTAAEPQQPGGYRDGGSHDGSVGATERLSAGTVHVFYISLM